LPELGQQSDLCVEARVFWLASRSLQEPSGIRVPGRWTAYFHIAGTGPWSLRDRHLEPRTGGPEVAARTDVQLAVGDLCQPAERFSVGDQVPGRLVFQNLPGDGRLAPSGIQNLKNVRRVTLSLDPSPASPGLEGLLDLNTKRGRPKASRDQDLDTQGRVLTRG
jgi:hypothetical protein